MHSTSNTSHIYCLFPSQSSSYYVSHTPPTKLQPILYHTTCTSMSNASSMTCPISSHHCMTTNEVSFTLSTLHHDTHTSSQSSGNQRRWTASNTIYTTTAIVATSTGTMRGRASIQHNVHYHCHSLSSSHVPISPHTLHLHPNINNPRYHSHSTRQHHSLQTINSIKCNLQQY